MDDKWVPSPSTANVFRSTFLGENLSPGYNLRTQFEIPPTRYGHKNGNKIEIILSCIVTQN